MERCSTPAGQNSPTGGNRFERVRKRLIVAFLGILIIYGGLRYGKPVYRRVMAERLLHAAQAKAAAQDATEATRLYVLALQKDSGNIGILTSFASFLMRGRDPQAIWVRARICQLNADDDGAFLDYVESVLAFGEAKMAHGLLLRRGSQPGSRIQERARFVHLLGTCYFLENNVPLAEAAYSEAAQRDPKNRRYLVNQAQLRLYASNPAIRDTAIATLQAASEHAEERQMVLPSLLQYASQAPAEPPGLEDWLKKADDWLAPTDEGFSSLLAAQKRWRPDRLAARLGSYAKAAAARSEGALAMERWFLRERMFAELLALHETLSRRDQSSFEILCLASEAMFALKRMDRLEEFLEQPAWKAMEAERLAWKERVRRALAVAKTETQRPEEEAREWQRILRKARDDPQGLYHLAEMTQEWGWVKEYEKTLWEAADRENVFSGHALDILSRTYLERGDGNEFLRVIERQSQIAPNDPVMTNNLAYMSFLFRRGEARATRLSNELSQHYPQSADFVSTNAFGLLMKGDVAGGLKLFEKTSPEALVGTSAGVTYGLLLAANGNHDAGRFLKDAERWTRFPEERQLITEARKKIEP